MRQKRIEKVKNEINQSTVNEVRRSLTLKDFMPSKLLGKSWANVVEEEDIDYSDKESANITTCNHISASHLENEFGEEGDVDDKKILLYQMMM